MKIALAPGTKAVINGGGDLMMVREDGAWIGRSVEVVKVTKGGMVYVTDGREFHTFRPMNVDVVATA